MLKPPCAAKAWRTIPPSTGSVPALPRAISTPPPWTNLLRLSSPSKPMPPVMSSEPSGIPWLGNSGVVVNGSGLNFVSMPCTRSVRLPPVVG